MLETNRLSEKPHSDLLQLTEQDVHLAVQTLHDAGYVDFVNRVVHTRFVPFGLRRPDR